MFSLLVSVNRSIPDHEIGIFNFWICAFLSWLFWLNSAPKLKVLLQTGSLHLYLFWEFLGKNDSTWDYWETSTLCQGTWPNTPAQLLRKASCQKCGFRKLKCWWSPKSAQGSELLCVKRFLLQTPAQQRLTWAEGTPSLQSAMKALSCGKDFMEKPVFITLSINNNKF